jgi:hypothetical protein
LVGVRTQFFAPPEPGECQIKNGKLAPVADKRTSAAQAHIVPIAQVHRLHGTDEVHELRRYDGNAKTPEDSSK